MGDECSSPRYVRASGSKQSALLDDTKPQAQLRGELSPDQFFCLVRFQLDKVMNPQERATMYPERFQKSPGFYEKGYDELKERLCEGRPLDAVFVDVDIHRGKPTGHEGRHRASAAHELGIEKVPAIVYVKDAFELWGPGESGIQLLTAAEMEKLDAILGRCGIRRDGRSIR